MLRQRIITAVLMLAVLLPALFHASPWPFAGLTVLLLAAAAWEWGRLNGLSPVAARGMGAACALTCLLSWSAGLLQHDLLVLWALAGMGWVLGGTRLLAGGVPAWQLLSRGLRCLLGLLCLWAAWLAVVQARDIGLNFLLSTLTLVWMADVAAYFAGKAWGGRFIHRKLAPGISPGKSWEGAIGGALGVLVLGAIWSQVELLGGGLPVPERSLHGQLLAQHGWFVWPDFPLAPLSPARPVRPCRAIARSTRWCWSARLPAASRWPRSRRHCMSARWSFTVRLTIPCPCRRFWTGRVRRFCRYWSSPVAAISFMDNCRCSRTWSCAI